MRLTAHAARAFDLAFVEGSAPVEDSLRAVNDIRLTNLETEPLIHSGRIDYLVHIEHIVRIPAPFDLLHQGIAPGTVHQGYEFAAEAAVAVLAAEAAAVLAHQLGSLLGHGTEQSPPLRGLYVYYGTKVQLARADMAVEHTAQAKAVEHRPEIRHIGRQPLGRNGRILDDADGLGIALHSAQDAEAGLAQRPYSRDIRTVHSRADIGAAAGQKLRFQRVRISVHRRAAELGDQQRRRIPFDEEAVALRLEIVLPKFQDTPVHQLHRRRTVAQRNQVGFEGVRQRRAMRAQDHRLLRRQRVQRHLDLRHERKRTLATADELAEIDGRKIRRRGGCRLFS